MEPPDIATYAPGESIPELLAAHQQIGRAGRIPSPDKPQPDLMREPELLPATSCPACNSEELVKTHRSLVVRFRCISCGHLIAVWRPGMRNWSPVGILPSLSDQLASVLARMNEAHYHSRNNSTQGHSEADKLLVEALLLATRGTEHSAVAEGIVTRYEGTRKYYA